MDDILKHYASKYYDPVKAHEYYEAHKKLKGRTSTAGLNEEGRKVASYVRTQITNEKRQRLETNASNRKSQIEPSVRSCLFSTNKTLKVFMILISKKPRVFASKQTIAMPRNLRKLSPKTSIRLKKALDLKSVKSNLMLSLKRTLKL